MEETPVTIHHARLGDMIGLATTNSPYVAIVKQVNGIALSLGVAPLA